MLVSKYPLYYLTWNVTNRCNLKCRHCYATSGETEYENELTAREVLSVIDDAVKLGLRYVLLTGGEPLLRSDLFEIGASIKKRGLKVFLSTNGTLLNKENTHKLLPIVDHINVSLDAATPEVHDSIRGVKGSFDLTLNGIRVALAAGIRVVVSMTVHDDNLDEVYGVCKICEELGAPLLIKRYVPVGRGRKSGVTLSKTSYKRLCGIVDELTARGFDIIFKDPLYISRRKQIGNKIGGCLAGIHILSIGHNGDIFPCTKLHFPLGNIRNDSLKDIWLNNETLHKFRERKLFGKCGKCFLKYQCGGCRAAAYGEYGDPFASDPLCLENFN